MDRRRLLAYVIFALVLGPTLISAIPLIAPEKREAIEVGESMTAETPQVSADDSGVKPEISFDKVETESGRKPIPLPLLWLLNLFIALLVYLIARHLIP